MGEKPSFLLNFAIESKKEEDVLNEAESVLADRNSDSRYEFILK